MQFINYGILQEEGITSPLWLYDEGEKFTSTTGGWEVGLDGGDYGEPYDSGSYLRAGIQRVGDCSWATYFPIDVTEYSNLTIRWAGERNGGSPSYTVNFHTSKTQAYNDGALITRTVSVSYTHLTLPTKRIV